MAENQKKKAFTLIELLVVVLIIGILAAVALPQYQKAVAKARVGTILPMLSGILKAQEIYYMNNQTYAKDARELDVTPENCVQLPATEEEGTEGRYWGCGKDFVLNISALDSGSVSANYCPGYNTTYESCDDHKDFAIVFGSAHSTHSRATPNTHYCWQGNNSTFGKEVCKSIGKPTPCGSGGTCYELH